MKSLQYMNMHILNCQSSKGKFRNLEGRIRRPDIHAKEFLEERKLSVKQKQYP